MTYPALARAAAAVGLDIFGAFHPLPDDGAPIGCQTLIMLGPKEPGYWAMMNQSPEFRDGAADPVDRWSTRVISGLAAELGAAALFPFGGPPYQPFIAWALRSGRAWASPVGLLVHDTAGLFLSYRGALAFEDHFDLPDLGTSPCKTCADKACLTACPASALTERAYDVPGCRAFLETPQGTDCLNRGCAVRRSCPVSTSYGRVELQSAHHMRAFHGG